MFGSVIGRVLAFLVLIAALVGVLLYSQRETGPLRVSGFLEADQIRVGSRVGGRVAAVHVAEGDEVEAGALLIEFEPYDLLQRRAEAAAELERRKAELMRLSAGYRPEEIAQAEARRDRLAAQLAELRSGPRPQEIGAAEARVREADASVELANQEFARVKELFDRQSVSADELDRATRSQRVAEEQRNARRKELELLEAGTREEVLEQAKAQVAEAEAALQLVKRGFRAEEIAQARAAVAAANAALSALDARIAELRVVAPVAGRVEALDLRKGDLLAPDAPALSLLDPQRLWVRAFVPENRLSFSVGDTVRVRVDAIPGRTFEGQVTFLASQAEFLPGNVQTPEERSKQVFRIKVDLREGLDVLHPGVPADVVFE